MIVIMEDNTSRDAVTKKPIEWKGHEYTHFEKGSDWYWALGLMAVAGAVAALIFQNVLFALFILIAAFVLALLASRKPNEVSFAISQRGIRIDTTLYPFQTLKSFGIEELTPEHTPRLIFRSKKLFAMDIIIPLEHVHANEVHDFLINFLEEDDHSEPLIHKVMEWLGF